MRKPGMQILSTWPFVLCLTLLISNDWYLKAAYPGLITGKLSDFSGIAVVALLLLSVYPQHFFRVALSISLAFLWWKSPAADGAIQTFNTLALYRIGRVQDYSDLLALLVIPLCQIITRNPDRFALHRPRLRQWLTAPIAAITLFGIMGTSSMPTEQNYRIQSAEPTTALSHEQVAQTIQSVAQQFNLSCSDCAPLNPKGAFQGHGLTLRYHFNAAGAIEFSVTSYSDGFTTFSKSGEEKAEALKQKLKEELGRQFPQLDYIERLGPKSP